MAADDRGRALVDDGLAGSEVLRDRPVDLDRRQPIGAVARSRLECLALVLARAKQDLLGVADSGPALQSDRERFLHAASVGHAAWCGDIGRSTDRGTGCRRVGGAVPPGTGTSGYGLRESVPASVVSPMAGRRPSTQHGKASPDSGRSGSARRWGAHEPGTVPERVGVTSMFETGSSRRWRVRVTTLVLAAGRDPVYESARSSVRLGGRTVGRPVAGLRPRRPNPRPNRRPSLRPSRPPSRLPSRPPSRPPSRLPTRLPSPPPSRPPTRPPTRPLLPTPDPTPEPTPDPTPTPATPAATSSPSPAALAAATQAGILAAAGADVTDSIAVLRHRARSTSPTASTVVADLRADGERQPRRARPRPRRPKPTRRHVATPTSGRCRRSAGTTSSAPSRRPAARSSRSSTPASMRSHPDLAGQLVAGTSILDGVRRHVRPERPRHRHGRHHRRRDRQRSAASPASAMPASRSCPSPSSNADGLGQDSDIIEGVVWAVDHGADVINMSFSQPRLLGRPAGRHRLRLGERRRPRRRDRQRRLLRRHVPGRRPRRHRRLQHRSIRRAGAVVQLRRRTCSLPPPGWASSRPPRAAAPRSVTGTSASSAAVAAAAALLRADRSVGLERRHRRASGADGRRGRDGRSDGQWPAEPRAGACGYRDGLGPAGRAAPLADWRTDRRAVCRRQSRRTGPVR